MKQFVITIFGLMFIFKSIIWWATVPIWQAPDEQAHFAQLQYIAENNTLTLPQLNLSNEVAISEKLLGTFRDKFGNNQYTYHPEFKPVYSLKIENELNNLPKSYRTEYVGQEAAGYPPLYYVLDTPLYTAVYNNGLIDRVFSARLLSVVLGLALVIITYLIGIEIWGQGIFAFALAGLVAFQPMVSFVSAGIHPDNLLNLLYSVGILLLLLILKNGNKAKYWFWLGTTIFLGLATKQLMFLFIPVAGATVFWRLKFKKLSVLVLVAPVLVFIFQIKMPFVPYVTPNSPLYSMGFSDYLKFRIPKLAFEIWPWYWGVFKWLGVTLPPLVMKVITRVTVVAIVGLVINVLIAIKKRNGSFENKALTLFVLSIVTYGVYLFFWDWRLMQANGFSQGLQGRYFLPNIVPEMALILTGLLFWVPKKIKNFSACVVLVGMICLNIVAWKTVVSSYYDFSSWTKFSTEFVQYKPQILKNLLR